MQININKILFEFMKWINSVQNIVRVSFNKFESAKSEKKIFISKCTVLSTNIKNK